MFCTNCGQSLQPDHRFCAQCGQARNSPAAVHAVEPARDRPSTEDWRTETDYRAVIGHPDVEAFVAAAAARKQGGMTGEEFLKKIQPVLNAAGGTGVPVSLIAELAQPMYAKLGVKTGTEVRQGYASPFGSTMAATLCSLAMRNQTLVSAQQATNGCVLSVDLPSSITAFAGNMALTLETVPEGTMMTGAVTIPGQAYDWGRSKKVLEQLHQDILNFRSLHG